MADLRPKPTLYNGYVFRSKLEAKWAVFFDLLGIPYQYEPEAFDCSDGSQYTPDFYLPKSYLRGGTVKPGLYLEIKPLGWEEDREYIYRIGSAFHDTGNLVLLCGDPFDVFKELAPDQNQQLSPEYDRGLVFMYCRSCRVFKVDYPTSKNYHCPLCSADTDDVESDAIWARGHQFEFNGSKK